MRSIIKDIIKQLDVVLAGKSAGLSISSRKNKPVFVPRAAVVAAMIDFEASAKEPHLLWEPNSHESEQSENVADTLL